MMSVLLPTVLQFIGLTANVIGAFLMASAYLNRTGLLTLPSILWSGLFCGNTARGAARLYDGDGTVTHASDKQIRIASRNALKFFQGLSFVALGFLLQAIGMLWQMASDFP